MAIAYTEAFIAIGASDFPAVVDFYRRLFGREPDERIRDVYAAFRPPGLHLGIFAPNGANRSEFANPPGVGGGLSLVLGVADVDRARQELAALNPLRPPGPIESTRHGREFYAYDPDGNRVIVVERPPRVTDR